MMDIVERIKDFTLDGAGYNSEHNCMLLDAISEIESLRAQLDKPQPTSHDVVDAVLAEREACAHALMPCRISTSIVKGK